MSERAAPAEPEEDRPRQRLPRSADLLGRRNSKLRRDLDKTWDQVKRGYEDQARRADRQADNWDAYFCRLNANQYYNGESEIFVPIIRDAVKAIATRDTNQLCPASGQFVEAISQDGAINGPIVDLLHEYAATLHLKTDVVQTAIVMGLIEGQYNLYMDWWDTRREIVSRATTPATTPEGLPIPGEDVDDVEVTDVTEGRPIVELLHDSDVLIRPDTADSVDEALAAGGFVAIARRWSKEKLRKLKDAGLIRADVGGDLEEQMDAIMAGSQSLPESAEKLLNEIAGIRKKGSEVLIWELWKRLPLNERGQYDEENGVPRLCRVLMGPDRMILGGHRNPHWNDRCPLISRPVEKVAGVMKGAPPVDAVLSIQYEANDAVNEGADAAHYAAMPVFLRDPASGNDPIILNLGAIIDVPPASFKLLEWPDLTPRAIARIQYATAQIFQSLGVNPSMLPQQTSTSRRNQAQVAQEQAIDLLTTSIRVGVLEEVMTEVVGWMVDLDYQFRDREMTVLTHGAMGVRANMQAIPAFKTREYYRFRWWGADAARNAAQYQQQIAFLNVAGSMQPLLQAQGKSFDPVPALEASAGGIFGPRIAPLIIKDMRAQWSIPPELENQMLAQGDEVPVSPLDDDPKHLQAHQQGMAQGDPSGAFAMHIRRHMAALQAKNAAMMAQQVQGMLMGQAADGGEQRPSRAGRPQPGGQVMPMRPNRGPPGMTHPDQLPQAGGIAMPRKM